jgi:hypothetical protein
MSIGRSGGRPAPRRGAGPPPVVFFGAAAAVLAIGLIAVTVAFAVNGDDDRRTQIAFGEPAATGLAPVSYSKSSSTRAFDAINSRVADSALLSAREAFPATARSLAVAGAGRPLMLRGDRIDSDCAAAVWGAELGHVLRHGECNQAVRGVYSNGTYAVTVAILNLADVAAANRAVDALGEGTKGGGFVKPLPLPAPLNRFGQGFSVARGLAMGHYVVVCWVQRLDGKGDAQDDGLLSLLVETGGPPAVLGRAARPGAGGRTRPAGPGQVRPGPAGPEQGDQGGPEQGGPEQGGPGPGQDGLEQGAPDQEDPESGGREQR